jgi:hypothetical protein
LVHMYKITYRHISADSNIKIQPWKFGIHIEITCLAGLLGLQTPSVFVRIYTFSRRIVRLHAIQTPHTATTDVA